MALRWLLLICLLCGALARGALAQGGPAAPVLRIETGTHSAKTTDAAADAAGRVLVTVSDDKTARVWSLPDLQPRGVLRPPIGPGNDGNLDAVAVSPDGHLAAVGGSAAPGHAALFLFDLKTRQIVRRSDGLPNAVRVLAFSPDGTRLAVGLAGDNGVRVFDTNGAEVFRDTDYADNVYGVSFAPDLRLATASDDGAIRLYDRAGKLLHKVQPEAGKDPIQIAFSPGGKELAVGLYDANAVEIRDGFTLALLARPDTGGLNGTMMPVVAWSRDGKIIYGGGDSGDRGGREIFAWGERGRGKRAVAADGFGGAGGAIVPLPEGRLAGLALNGDLAVLDATGSRIAARQEIAADFATPIDVAAPSFHFYLDRTGRRVAWSFFASDKAWHGFNPATLDATTSAASPDGLTDWSDHAGKLQVTAWNSRTDPKLNGRRLELHNYEYSQSVAVADDRVLLGTEWNLRLFGPDGQLRWQQSVPDVAWRVNQSPDGRLAVAALGDGTIRWYRVDNGQELLAVFFTRDAERWIAFTPTGYYAASPGAEDLIGWHVNRGPDEAADFFPASRFRDRFYRPDVVKLVLDTLDETEALRQADAARGVASAPAAPIVQDLPPVVTILTPADGTQLNGAEATIGYTVRSPSGKPVQAVRVLVDGVAVPDLHVALPTPAAGDAEARGEVRVPIPAGRSVTVALVADTASRTGEPAKRHLQGQPHRVASALAPRLNAVLIGVSAYADTDLRKGVEYAANDATALQDMLLRQRERGLYKEVNIKLLTDVAANRVGVVDAMDWLRRTTTSNDIAVVYLAGHGMADDGRVFFLPADGEPQRLIATAVGQADLLSLMGHVVGKKVAFLDFCHAGGAVLAQKTRGDNDVDMVGLMNELREPGSGLIVFAAATSREPAIQLDDRHHGAFTVALLEALDGEADLLHHGAVGTGELNVFLADRVRTLTNGKQHPIMERADDLPDFPLVVTR